MYMSPQDVAAAAVSVILSIGIVLCAAFKIEVPGALASAEGTAIGWLFVRSAQEGAKHTFDGYTKEPAKGASDV